MGRREGIYYYHEVLPTLREKVSEWTDKPTFKINYILNIALIIITIRLAVDFFIHTKVVKTFLRSKSFKVLFYKLKNWYQGKTSLKLEEFTDIDLKERLEVLLECREQNLTFHYTSKKKSESLRQIVEFIQKFKQKEFERLANKRKNNRKVDDMEKKTEAKLKIKKNKSSKKTENEETEHTSEESVKKEKDTKKKIVKKRNKKSEQEDTDEDKNSKKPENESENKTKQSSIKDKQEDNNKEESANEEDGKKVDSNIEPNDPLEATQENDDDELEKVYSLRDLVSCKTEDDFFDDGNLSTEKSKDLVLELLNRSIKKRQPVIEVKKNKNKEDKKPFLIAESNQPVNKNNSQHPSKTPPKRQSDFWIIQNMDNINDEISK